MKSLVMGGPSLVMLEGRAPRAGRASCALLVAFTSSSALAAAPTSSSASTRKSVHREGRAIATREEQRTLNGTTQLGKRRKGQPEGEGSALWQSCVRRAAGESRVRLYPWVRMSTHNAGNGPGIQ